MKWTQEKLILLYKTLEERIGAQPTKKQWIEDASTPSVMPIRQRFGNWTKFLEVIGKKPKKWIPTKNGVTRKGTRNAARKRIKNRQGYIEIFEPSHPVANKSGYALEHRIVMWDCRKLSDLSMEVHHINGIKDDNREENLEVLTKQVHTSITWKGKSRTENAGECKLCETRTRSKYKLCRKHYKLEWQRDNLL